jgi:hypothetical protein
MDTYNMKNIVFSKNFNIFFKRCYDMKIKVSKNLYDNVKNGFNSGYSIYELATINEVSVSIVRQLIDDWNVEVVDVLK